MCTIYMKHPLCKKQHLFLFPSQSFTFLHLCQAISAVKCEPIVILFSCKDDILFDCERISQMWIRKSWMWRNKLNVNMKGWMWNYTTSRSIKLLITTFQRIRNAVLFRQEAVREENEWAEWEALEREAAHAEPQVQLRRVKDAHGPPEHILQPDGGEDIDGLCPWEPPVRRSVFNTHPRVIKGRLQPQPCQLRI